jgi:hypothetical protein
LAESSNWLEMTRRIPVGEAQLEAIASSAAAWSVTASILDSPHPFG